MNHMIIAHKADPLVSDTPIDGVVIEINTDLPRTNNLEEAQALHNEDANRLFLAMKMNLPQGTRHRLAQLFLEDSVNLYRGR